MKSICVILCVSVLALSARAREYTAWAMPASTTPVAEMSRNVAFNIQRNDTRMFAFLLETTSVSSNAVQVAFGTDVDGNGDLAAEETDLVLGMDPGLAFIENVAEDARTETTDIGLLGTNRFIKMTVRTDRSLTPKSCAFTNETGACFADVSAACPGWTFKSEWNLFKVTRRGAYGSNERVLVTSDYNSMAVIVR